jgi:hypothetical protein
MIIEICYVLGMLGVPVEGPAVLLGDNNSVVLNTTVPSLILMKKHRLPSSTWSYCQRDHEFCTYPQHYQLCRCAQQATTQWRFSQIGETAPFPRAYSRKRSRKFLILPSFPSFGHHKLWLYHGEVSNCFLFRRQSIEGEYLSRTPVHDGLHTLPSE